MAKYTIMLVCAGGMSSSMLAVRMAKAAKKKDIDARVFAIGAHSVEDQIERNHPDVIMIGPQVRFITPEVRKKTTIPVGDINFLDYGRMHGEQVLQAAMNLLKAQ